MGRKKIQDERRLQIIQALYACLLKKPFRETSIKDIAAAAGVNHGVLHYYFTCKEEILLTFIDHTLQKYKSDFIDHMKSRVSALSAPGDVIAEMFNFANNRITLDRKLAKIFIEIWEIGLYDRKVRARLKVLYNEWVQTAQDTIIRAVGDETQARRISKSIVAFLEGMSLLSVLLDQNESEMQQTLEAFQRKIIGMLSVDSRR